jgi:hypothetical protein
MNIGYIRISHTDSLDGTSLEVQEKRIKAYADLHGFKIDKVYSEICSGSVNFSKRPVFSKVLNDLKKGSLVNMTNGGEGSYGFKHTECSKQKLKTRLKGNKYNLGTKYSDKVKKHLSDIRTGKSLIKTRKPILCTNTNITYDSVSIAAKQLNLKQGDISNVLTNRQKSTKGYTFIYIL